MPNEDYFSVKTKDESQVLQILNKAERIEITGLNVFESNIKIGQLVFVVLGGDKPNWPTGLIGIAAISKEPYDKGYDISKQRNFKIMLDMKILLQKPITRADLLPFSDTYGIIGIAPIVRWEPNQAITQVATDKAAALLRAMLELDESIKSDLPTIVGKDMMKLVTGVANKSISIPTYYGENEQQALTRYMHNSYDQSQSDSREENKITYTKSNLKYKTGIQSQFPHNRIIFGAPGTGKSYSLMMDVIRLLGNTNEFNHERVTFHPEYSYANFIGTYKPVTKNNSHSVKLDKETQKILSILKDNTLTNQEKYDLLYENFNNKKQLTTLPILMGCACECDAIKTKLAGGEPSANDNKPEFDKGKNLKKYLHLASFENDAKSEIRYEFVPGPFMRIYAKALKNAQTDNPKPFVLIIEEINRANVAAVFGDIFQLLDRDEENISEYPIQASEEIKQYLAKEFNKSPDEFNQLRLPDNLFIWATMNSADQGVFPMDTAFKRRWEFKYLGIDDNSKEIQGKFVTLGNGTQRIEWNELRTAINEYLAEVLKVPEDKQLGPFFLPKSLIVPSDNISEIDSNKFIDVFKNKVIMYLFEDAARQKRASLFDGSNRGTTRYSKICEAFDEQGIGIFNQFIKEKITIHAVLPEPEFTEIGTSDEGRE